MIHSIALLPALLLPLASSGSPVVESPATTPSRNLLTAVPATAFLAVYLPDPKALIAARETNDWIALATDPEWQTITRLFRGAMGEEPEGAGWMQLVQRGLADSTGLVLFVDLELDKNEPTLGIIAEGGTNTTALLRWCIRAETLPHTMENGSEVLVTSAGRHQVFHESNGVSMVILSHDEETAMRTATECLDAIDGTAPRGPFAVPELAAERRPAAVEVAFDFSPLWSDLNRTASPNDGLEKRVFDALASMGWMYGSVSFGKDEVSDWEFVLPYGPETLLGEFMRFFGSADTELFRTIPAGASDGMIVAFDMSGCADWVMALVLEESPEKHARMIGGLTAITEMAGIDIMGDVVHNMTGQYIYFGSTTARDTGTETLGEVQALTLVIGMEDSDPLLDMVDVLLDMTGLGAAVENDASSVAASVDGDDEIEVWRVDAGLGLVISIGVGAGRLVLSIDEVGFDRYLALAAGTEGAATILSDVSMASAAESVSGAAVSVQSIPATLEAMQSMTRTYVALFAGASTTTEETARLAMASDAMDRLTILLGQYLQGTVSSELQIADGRIRSRTRIR